jgi:triacylglycerol esterase/lipase EstA (alpha/beta hydrolase family)
MTTYVRRSVNFFGHSAGGANIRLLSCKCNHVSAVADVRFVRLALKVVMRNDGDFV